MFLLGWPVTSHLIGTRHVKLLNSCLFLSSFNRTLDYPPRRNIFYLRDSSRSLKTQQLFLTRAYTVQKAVMVTVSSELDEGPSSKLNLLDLPQEVKDRIWGYTICGIYSIFPSAERWSRERRVHDYGRESILRVSKRTNYEAMQVLKRRSWFIYTVSDLDFSLSNVCQAPTQDMMNVELIIDEYPSVRWRNNDVIMKFAGTKSLRRTCHILITKFKHILYTRMGLKFTWLRLYFEVFKLLTGFTTVVLQIDLDPEQIIQEVKERCDDDSVTLPIGMVKSLEPALGPAMPCNPVQKQEYGMNFKFSPRRFAAERLASAELGV